MKNIYLLLLILALAFPALAQTNFRPVSYEEAIVTAKAENKLVFIDFYTSWCGPCKMMAKDVFPQKIMGDYLNERFVCIKLDAEKEGKEAAKRYEVKAYPTFIGIDGSENVVMTKVGMAQAEEFIAAIDRQIDPEKNPERMKQRYDAGERTAGLIQAYAALKMEESRAGRNPDEAKRKEAFEMVQGYFEGLKDAGRLAAENLFIYNSYIDGPEYPIARYMITHRNEFAPEIKAEITERIEQLFKQQIGGYLSGDIPYEVKTYQDVKKDITDLGLNKEGKYSIAFRLIECHATGDLNAYLTLCEQEFNRMPRELQSALMFHISSAIDTQDETIRKRAATFVRKQFLEMDANLILWAAMELVKLEGGGKH